MSKNRLFTRIIMLLIKFLSFPRIAIKFAHFEIPSIMKILRKFLLFLLSPIGIRRKGDLVILFYFRRHLCFAVKMLRASRSQISQDVFVSCQLQLWKKENKKGFFVEFGATDGIYLSNTYILEKKFYWDGLLIEPARIWREALTNNRDSKIDFRCVYDKTGEHIAFNENKNAVYSTIDQFSELDIHKLKRNHGLNYMVDTVTLNDVLVEHRAPSVIDYLSIDTEGSEFRILQSVNFNNWSFKVITVEHNYMPQRNLIYNLLTQNGYKRVLEHISLMDDWYIKC